MRHLSAFVRQDVWTWRAMTTLLWRDPRHQREEGQ